MRNGWSPSKMPRKRSKNFDVSVGVLNHIPELAGYYADGLRVLGLCLLSIRQHADRDFELIVADNNSCPEVREFLLEQQASGLIDTLILNSANLGHNGIAQMMAATTGSYFFFSDWDIYHRPNYMKEQISIVENFPNVGMVGGRPTRHLSQKYTERTKSMIENRSDMTLEEGHFIPYESLLEFAEQTGGHVSQGTPEERVDTLTKEHKEIRLSYKNKQCYLGASHMQYLMPRKAIDAMGIHWHDEVRCKTEVVDLPLADVDFLRITTTEAYVDHIGNALDNPKLAKEYQRLLEQKDMRAQQAAFGQKDGSTIIDEKVWQNPTMRKLLFKMYLWSFKKYSQFTENTKT